MESDLKLLKEKKATLDLSIESLWQQVHPESTEAAKKRKKAKARAGNNNASSKEIKEAEAVLAAAGKLEVDNTNLKWREDITVRLEIAVKHNEKLRREREKLFPSRSKIPEVPEEESKAVVTVVLKEEEEEEEEQLKPSDDDREPVEDVDDGDAAARTLRWAQKEEDRRAKEIEENSRLLQEMLEHGADAYLERQRKRKEEEERKKLANEEEHKRKELHDFAFSLVSDIVEDAVDNISEAIAWKHRDDVKYAVDAVALSTVQSVDQTAVEHVSSLILQQEDELADEAARIVTNILIDETVADAEYMGSLEAIILERQRLARIAEATRNAVAETIQDVIQSVVMRLADPWLPLDDDPRGWLTTAVLATVEVRRERSREHWMRSLLRLGFTLIARDWRILQMKRRRDVHTKIIVFKMFSTVKLDNIQQRYDSASTIQRTTRSYLDRKARRRYIKHLHDCNISADRLRDRLLRRNAAALVKYLRKRVLVKWRGEYIAERGNRKHLVAAYQFWKQLQKQLAEAKKREVASRLAATLLIRFRLLMLIARIRLKKNVMARRINRLIRGYLGRRRASLRCTELRLIAEKSVAVTGMTVSRMRKLAWRHWFHFHKFNVGFTKWDSALSSIFYKDAFVLWRDRLRARKSLELRSAIKIQSTVRMWYSQKYLFAYHRWRRSLCKFQALCRAVGPRIQFRSDFPYYRAAKSIQRIFRGFLIRNDFASKRVRDIHYASRTNNYDRLLYYVNNYPELVNEYDDEGNSALHNAAKTASKRTLKLLARSNLDMNALNFAGYSPLHLVIMSTAINRDDVCQYMIERGFDDAQKTSEGKSTLLLACEHGRSVIAKYLLEYGMDPNLPDSNGNTCLQFACTQGMYPLVEDLIEHVVDVNYPGHFGSTPLHECLASGDIDIVNLLLSHGAYVDAKEPYHNQTPLMWACRAGLTDIVKQFILQGASISVKDTQGYTCAHHAVFSDSEDVYNALREADVHIEDVDNDGNTPLHIACENGCSNFAKHLLEGGVNPSLQNLEGDQPAHFAARNNNVDILRSLSLYDEHIGRINFKHQTPLGAAKFASARQAEAFLEEQYRKIEIKNGRNKEGDIWWEKDFSEIVDDWSTVRYRNGRRVYVNSVTGEVSDEPPALQVDTVIDGATRNAVQLKKKMLIVPVENEVNTHTYLREVRAFQSDVREMKLLYRAAVVIQCMARKLIAKRGIRRRKIIRTNGMKILHFIVRYKRSFFVWKRERDRLFAIRIQAAWRGYALRHQIYQTDMFDKMVYHKNSYRLYCLLYRVWQGYRAYKTAAIVEHEMHAPNNEKDWGKIISRCGNPVRVIGAVEEYVAPGPGRIYIYRHAVTQICTFIKPKKLRVLDERDRRDGIEIAKHGHSRRQVYLATRLQALWRGFMTRSHAKYIEKALVVSLSIEREYFIDPDKDSNLYNFAMHCHVVLEDYDRARTLYSEAMRRMAWRGPDVAFVLYSYAVFSFVSHDLDYTDICMLLARARRAEETREELIRRKRGELEVHARIMASGTFRYGKVFDQARIGFFQHYAKTKNNAPSWHSYAAVLFLICFDFSSSFDAFLAAFQHDKTDRKLRANFDVMMQHFHGTDKYYLAKIIDERMQIVAKKDKEAYEAVLERKEQAYQRQLALKKLQIWFRRLLWDRQSIKIRETALQIRDRKVASRQKKLVALARAQGGGFPTS